MSTTGIVAASERNWDSALARTNSYVIRPFHNFVARTYSVPDITGYYRIHDRSTPKWLSGARHFKRTWPVEENFYSNLAKKYWRDRYYYFSPMYNRISCPRPFQSTLGVHPYTYWARYDASYGSPHQNTYNYPIEDFLGY